jgi:hypothetical protein
MRKISVHPEVGKMKLGKMVCCSWHTPRNAIVDLNSGRVIGREILDSIPASPEKEDMLFSGGMCGPCSRKFLSRFAPKAETILGAKEGQGAQPKL